MFAAIQNAHGGGANSFNLPDYRGRFLRGATGTINRDPDAASRTAMNDAGNTGNNVGSIQEWATGKPRIPFLFNVNVGMDHVDSTICAGHDNSAWNGESRSVTLTAEGGDRESRPPNVNVDFYILASDDPNSGDIFPIGGIIGIPGNALPPKGQWLLCNGASISNEAPFEKLFLAIAHDNGGDGKTFYLPNLQGQFLRGCDHRQGRDPDVASRYAALAGGQIGDNVGSVENWATGSPHNPGCGDRNTLGTSFSTTVAPRIIW